MIQSGILPTAKLICVLLSFWTASAFSCVKMDFTILESELKQVAPLSDKEIISIELGDDPCPEQPDLDGDITAQPFAEISFVHQSAAAHGDFAILVMEHRQAIRLYDLISKRTVYTERLTAESSTVYHCNQSSFGTKRYDPTDYFPLLYISQRTPSESRCLTEVFRIIPFFNPDSTAILSFRSELVQEIHFPRMSKENSLGNVNCVIDSQTGWMYTYSRNNNGNDSNYGQCKISRFPIPDIYQREVYLEDTDIESSFLIGIKASNMQGGCISNGRLYIGQGYPNAKYVYLNVVDLHDQKLVKRYDLLGKGIDWEPEGCFFYDGNVMITHTKGICRMIEAEE